MMTPSTREEQVAEFHAAMGLPIAHDAYFSLLELRRQLIQEEADEVVEALSAIQRECVFRGSVPSELWENLLKELADLQYVLSGTLVSLADLNASDFDIAFNRVHKSNMSKLGDNGQPVKNSAGKVIKGVNYQPPYLKDLVG